MKNTRSDFDDMSIHRFFISLKYVAAITIVCWLSGGCLDETGRLNEAVSFSATVAQDMTKTVLGDRLSDGSHDVHWQAAETMIIGGAAYQLRNRIDAQNAILEPAVAHQYASRTDDGKYKAYYPASIYNNGTLALPDTQVYTPSEEGHPVITNLPMYAESENNQLQFRNLCAAIHFSVTGIAKITHVVVKSKSHALWGPFRIENHKAVMTGTDESYRTLTYRLSQGSPAEGVQLDPLAPTEVYIALPALEEYPAGDLTFTIYADDKVVRTLANPDQAVSLIRSSIYDFAAPTVWEYTISWTRPSSGLYFAPIIDNENRISNLKSFRTRGAEKEPVPFKMQYASSESGPWEDGLPDWIDVESGTQFNGSIVGESLKLYLRALTDVVPDPNVHTETLRRTPPVTTEMDLSLYNVATGSNVARTTANCYVVKAPGTYSFPLVYGNALKNGNIYEPAFRRQREPGANVTHYFEYFLDHNDEPITHDGNPGTDAVENSVFIAKRFAGKSLRALLIWEDEQGLVSVDQNIVGSGEDARIRFTVPSETICQGNAVIALLADDDIVWSWHIWVTDHDLTATGDGFYGFRFAPYCLGWCDGWSSTRPSNSIYIRAVTIDGDHSTQPVLVTQKEEKIYVHSNALYYQWGRKDPFPGYLGGVNKDKPVYKHLQYADSNHPYSLIPAGISVGTAICHPYAFVYIPDSTTPTDWCNFNFMNNWNSSHLNNSITETTVTKTIYDPSPSGFMVAPRAAHNGLANAGATYEPETSMTPRGHRYNGIFFPALGYRIHQTVPGSIAGYNNYGYHYNCDGGYSYTGRIIYAPNFSSFRNIIYEINNNSESIRANALPVHPVIEP